MENYYVNALNYDSFVNTISFFLNLLNFEFELTSIIFYNKYLKPEAIIKYWKYIILI